ncbi:DUF3986 family protein [Fictibacillus sp. BK138]|uniref:DUF3986 family protein n=1 Tax=Fictibacillus sp. BK138 TaxID=2512121 RepID=UPI001F5E8FAB|nr:DUF3986 family protein [Fictibacillus sp. BK138]
MTHGETAYYESIAYKRLSEDVRDLFFDFKYYGIKNPTQENELTLVGNGTRIFQSTTRNLIMISKLTDLRSG